MHLLKAKENAELAQAKVNKSGGYREEIETLNKPAISGNFSTPGNQNDNPLGGTLGVVR